MIYAWLPNSKLYHKRGALGFMARGRTQCGMQVTHHWFWAHTPPEERRPCRRCWPKGRRDER